MSQFSHIVRFIELRWIDFVNIFPIDLPLLRQISDLLQDGLVTCPTLPSSHCTTTWPFSTSSTIHPFTKALSGSLIHTYRLPEKSFSPSIPICSLLPCSSSNLINLGAKVLDVWLLLRVELDLCLEARAGVRVEPLNGERELFLAWLVGLRPSGGGGVSTLDIGLMLAPGRPVVGEVGSL